MKVLLGLLVILSFSVRADADEIFRIQIGKDYQNYSESDLKRRVYELERAVWQLQQQVFHLQAQQSVHPVHQADSWGCTITAMGESYTGTGPTKAVATARVIENCKSARNGDGFFCNSPKCEQ